MRLQRNTNKAVVAKVVVLALLCYGGVGTEQDGSLSD